MRLILLSLVLVACGEDSGEDKDGIDGGVTPMVDAGQGQNDGGTGGPESDAAALRTLDSSLSATCTNLSGRAIVNENGNLGVAFTDDSSPYTFRGSVSLELPSNFSGSIPNPEGWDGSSARLVVAVVDQGFTTFGNHCWFNRPDLSGGTAVVTDYRPQSGIMDVSFSGYVLANCNGGGTCTVNGSVRTEGEGVYDN